MKKTTKEKLTSKVKEVFSTKKDWTDIHSDFSRELKKEWKEKGFNYEQTKEWIDVGLQPSDAGFVQWLKEVKKIEAKRMRGENKELRKEYEKILEKNLRNSENSLELNNPRFKLCLECKQPNTGANWCKTCNSKHFQQEFDKWTSGNLQIDQFIQKYQLEATDSWKVLEWIPYEDFTSTSIEYLAEGGFGKVYKAEWNNRYIIGWEIKNNKWARSRSEYSKKVILKTLHNSQNITTEFLQEIINHKLVSSNNNIVKCYGISQDPETKNYVMVMPYMKGGNLREYLKDNYGKLYFYDKLSQLCYIAQGLKDIHQEDLIHRDFHSGNILNEVIADYVLCRITDLGLSKLSKEVNDGKIVGVLPYVAPEVLTKKTYSEASDIYSFGMIMYEVLTGLPPFYNIPHDEFLTIKICQGLRPSFKESKVRMPQLLEELIEKCWDADPAKRPTTSELSKNLNDWRDGKDTKFNEQYEEAKEKRTCELLEEIYKRYKEKTIQVKPEEIQKIKNEIYAEFCQKHNYDSKVADSRIKFNELFTKINNLNYTIHPSAIYTSRLLDFPNLPEPQNSREINEEFYSGTTLTSSAAVDNSTDYSNSSLQFDFAKKQEEENLQSHQELPPK